MNDVSLPAYARLAADRNEAGNLMLETMRAHAAIGLPVFWGIASVAATAVPVIFGEQWMPAVFPLVAMAVVAPIRLIGSVETPAMTGIGRAMVLAADQVHHRAGDDGRAVRRRLVGWRARSLARLAVRVSAGVRPRVPAGARAIGLSYAQVLGVLRGPAIAAGVMACASPGCSTWRRRRCTRRRTSSNYSR